MPIDKYTFGQKIRAARLSRSMSQARLADEIGVSPSTIAMYETGQRFPVLDNLDALADALNLPISYFIEDVPARIAALSAAEQRLLALFRSLNVQGQQEVSRYADYCSSKMEYQKNTQNTAT